MQQKHYKTSGFKSFGGQFLSKRFLFAANGSYFRLTPCIDMKSELETDKRQACEEACALLTIQQLHSKPVC
eukprot:3240468-Amphidinium_carterae.1